LDANGLEEDAVQYLSLHAPMKREDAGNVIALLEMMISGEEGLITQTKMMDVVMGYLAGDYTAELAQSRLSTPSVASGGGVPSMAPRFTPRSSGRASVAFSAMTEEGEEETATGDSEGLALSSRIEDDEFTAETSYDPAQTQFLLTRVGDLTSGLVKTNARVSLLKTDLSIVVSGLGRTELELESVQDSVTRLEGSKIVEAAEIAGRFAGASRRVEESIDSQRDVNVAVEARLTRMEEPFKSATGFPALFEKVAELATTVNGSVDGPPGAGIDARVRSRPPAAEGGSGGGGSFGFNLRGGREGSGVPARVGAVGTEHEVGILRQMVTDLVRRVGQLEASAARPEAVPIGGLGGLGPDVAERLEALEARSQSGTSITISSIIFNNERDVAAFVKLHVPTPNFGIVCDIVILLQTLKVANPTTESTAGLLAQAQKVNMDPLETAIVGSYGVELPTIFDRTQGVLTSSNLHPLPSAKTYADWSSASTGLRDKVNAELKNSVISARKRISDAGMSPTAVMVFRDLVSLAMSQWTSLAAFMDQQVSIMIGQYGLPTVEAWLLVGKTVRQIFVKLRERRVSGENVVTTLTSKQEQFVSVLWASLQGHALMAEYERDEYYGHHSLAAITAEHMLKHRVTLKEFTSLQDRVTTVSTAQDGLASDLDRCLDKAGLQPLRKKKRLGPT